jgi:hypothetical protein
MKPPGQKKQPKKKQPIQVDIKPAGEKSSPGGK